VLHAKWDISYEKDEMTGEKSAYASSSIVKPTKKMDFPYRNQLSWIGIGCKENSYWVYVGFNKQPNLSKTKTNNGFNEIQTRIKFDEKVEQITIRQDWGSKFIHFYNDRDIISKIKDSNKMLLELNWYSNGNVYFNYNLAGSSKAINKIFEYCNIQFQKQ
jgi:hypothetical protein